MTSQSTRDTNSGTKDDGATEPASGSVSAQWIEPNRVAHSSQFPALLRALRPHQWLKNLLLFLPLVLAHEVADKMRWLSAVLAFCSMCLCASAVYILNDLLDIDSDRRHVTKRNRPFASGSASIPAGVALAALVLIGGLALAASLPLKFQLLLVLYLLLTTAYSLWLKRKVLLDVMVLAGLYTLRIIAGAQAVQVPLTMWLLAFSMFFFLSLAFVKRYSELIEVEHTGGEDLKGRGYRVSDLRIIEAAGPTSGYLSVLVFCNYLNSEMVRRLYLHPQILWLVAPLLLYWITRTWFLARRRLMHEDAILFALGDKVSLLTGAAAAIVVLAAWLPAPRWWPF